MAGVSALIRDGGRVGGGNLAVLTFVLVLRCARPERPAPAGRDRTVVLRSHTSRIGTRALDLHGHLDAAGGVRARGSGYRGSGARRTRRAATDIRGGLQGCPARGFRRRRWRCGCGARTARRSTRRGRVCEYHHGDRSRSRVADPVTVVQSTRQESAPLYGADFWASALLRRGVPTGRVSCGRDEPPDCVRKTYENLQLSGAPRPSQTRT